MGGYPHAGKRRKGSPGVGDPSHLQGREEPRRNGDEDLPVPWSGRAERGVHRRGRRLRRRHRVGLRKAGAGARPAADREERGAGAVDRRDPGPFGGAGRFPRRDGRRPVPSSGKDPRNGPAGRKRRGFRPRIALRRRRRDRGELGLLPEIELAGRDAARLLPDDAQGPDVRFLLRSEKDIRGLQGAIAAGLQDRARDPRQVGRQQRGRGSDLLQPAQARRKQDEP